MPLSQKEKLINTLDTSYNLTEFNPAIHDLATKLDFTKLTDVENQTHILDSASYNRTVAGILTDLYILYDQSEVIENFVDNNNLLHMADIETLRKEVARLKTRTSSLKDYIESSTTTVVKTENFTSKSGLETIRHLFTDRDGVIASTDEIANIDIVQEVCKLPHREAIDATRNPNGHITAQIKLLNKTGSNDNASLGIENALDDSATTFWGESILTDMPIKNQGHPIEEGVVVEFEIILDKPRVINEIFLKPFGNYPVDIINIRYQEDINAETPLLPLLFDYFPKSVLNSEIFVFSPKVVRRIVVTMRQKNYSVVSYLATEESLKNESIWNTIKQLHENYALTTQGTWRNLQPNATNPSFIQEKLDEISGWEAYLKDYQRRLAEWEAKPFYYTTHSSSWTSTHTDPAAVAYNQIIDHKLDWGNAGSRAERDSIHQAANALRAVSPASWGLLRKEDHVPSAGGQVLYRQETFTETHSSSWSVRHDIPRPIMTKRRIQINKYEYLLGLHDIKIQGVSYLPTGIFVSKPYLIKGNAIEAEISVNERNTLIGIVNEATNASSIEYYLTHASLPSHNQWMPLLPKEQRLIFGELLLTERGNNQAVGRLRFRASFTSATTVYANGKPLSRNEWTMHPDFQHIKIINHNTHNRYTVDYEPDSTLSNPWRINLPKHGLHPTTVIDTFENGTDRNGTITLSQYPYIDHEKLRHDNQYVPMKVTLYDAVIAGPGNQVFNQVGPLTVHASTRNMTDYLTGSNVTLTPYNLELPHLVFEYVHNGDKIHFTETFNRAEALINQAINHGNAKIKVEYQVLASNVRIKAILRNTSALHTSTPILDDYSLKFFLKK